MADLPENDIRGSKGVLPNPSCQVPNPTTSHSNALNAPKGEEV